MLTLSQVEAKLSGCQVPLVPVPNTFVQKFLLSCSNGNREVAVVIDDPGLRGIVTTGLNNVNFKKVVVAVGINYGQGTEYCINKWPSFAPWNWFDETRMKPKIGSIQTAPIPQHLTKPVLPKDFHLIAANIFPFITDCPWSELTKTQ